MPFTRYAVYFLPEEGSALARFGASWLGWDSTTGQPVAHPAVAIDVAAITATPRKYGFHGTLKPPFRLAEGQSPEALEDALTALAARIAPFETPALRLAALGRFLALVPLAPSAPLADLAAACVRDLDGFRAPPTKADLARRRATRLTPAQDALLVQWGYPYVLGEFRFHMTLTGPLDREQVPSVQTALSALTAPFCHAPLPVRDIALLVEASGGAFHLIRRYRLGGSTG